MNMTDPKDAIIAYISVPRIVLVDTPVPNTQGWRMQQGAGGFGAKSETIRFVKERHLAQRQLHYVTFEDEEGRQMHCTCDVIADKSGLWKVQGVSGGAGRGPQRSSPWANLGGTSGKPFFAGGRVEDNGQEIARVRLISANGIVLEDSVDDGVVLFLDDRYIRTPLQAELYDSRGMLVGTHQVFRNRLTSTEDARG